MNFINSVKSGFKKYFRVKGRASRSEFWYWTLFTLLAGFVMAFADQLIFGAAFVKHHYSPLNVLFEIITFLPGFTLGVRRLQDRNRSVYWIATPMPVIWLFCAGTKGPNYYGPDPLAKPDSSGL